MEQKLKHISDELELSQESRERMRSQLIAYQTADQISKENSFMKKKILRTRMPAAVAIAVLAAALTVTACAVTVQQFRNNMIVSSADDIPVPSADPGGPETGYGVTAPNETPPFTLEEITESMRFKSDDWATGEKLNGGVITEYGQWDSAEVLSDDPALRSRRVMREDGAEKMEYTAENPSNLLSTLTGHFTLDLSWLDSQYDYVPDANLSYVITDPHGDYVNEFFQALYAKRNGNGYVRINIYNIAQEDYFTQSYIIEGSYETAYYYTSANGNEFLIEMNNGSVWAECRTSHASVSLYGAYLTSDEVEDILDNLSLVTQ